ncbi:hypothetical protein BSY19_4798 (plasmid) [Bosea sp. RAC05]|nr:hypothetical protein BSY19_4798 [Bosea sp. RAC05]
MEMGPSPRVRGRQERLIVSDATLRPIPARAGVADSLAHHVGGHSGPSPRVRGSPLFDRRIGDDVRSIPARAGETSGARRRLPVAKVHPRACGGDDLLGRSRRRGCGPSPRVRGRLKTSIRASSSSGSIPARAGETGLSRSTAGPVRVHPRACGGDTHASRRRLVRPGPSPRVRGRLSIELVLPLRGRSIPARAGETSENRVGSFEIEVHPRACGGDRTEPAAPGWLAGPSPRVRGRPPTSEDGRML